MRPDEGVFNEVERGLAAAGLLLLWVAAIPSAAGQAPDIGGEPEQAGSRILRFLVG